MKRFKTRISYVLLAVFSAVTVLFVTHKVFAETEKQTASEVTRQKISLTQAVILGVVEGITEYLPVSSTGHLILAGHFMGLTHYSDHVGPFRKLLDKNKMEATDSFDIVIQFGAILAVIGLYRKRVGQICSGLVGQNRDGLRLFLLLMAAFLPAAIIGLPFHKKIEAELFGPMPVVYA